MYRSCSESVKVYVLESPNSKEEIESMKTNYKIMLGILAGALIGVGGATAIHARQTKVMPGYAIAEVDVTDPATFQKYAEKVPGTIAAYGGHYMVRGGKVASIEGDAAKAVRDHRI